MLGSSREYRRNALECILLSRKAKTPAARKTFQELAGAWSKLATELEAGEKVLAELHQTNPQAAAESERLARPDRLVRAQLRAMKRKKAALKRPSRSA